jgi:DNA-binding IclR family transcriptional regulator
MAGNAKDPGRSVISKVSAILWSITEGSGHSLTEIAVRSKLPMSTVHRLATELAAWGVLERDKDGRFRAGRPVRALGDDDCPAAVPGTPSNLRDRAAPVMEDLFRATGLPVKAGSLDGTAVALTGSGAAMVSGRGGS